MIFPSTLALHCLIRTDDDVVAGVWLTAPLRGLSRASRGGNVVDSRARPTVIRDER